MQQVNKTNTPRSGTHHPDHRRDHTHPPATVNTPIQKKEEVRAGRAPSASSAKERDGDLGNRILPLTRPFPRCVFRQWRPVVVYNAPRGRAREKRSPPRGPASVAARGRVPPTVAPGSMTAQVGLVLLGRVGWPRCRGEEPAVKRCRSSAAIRRVRALLVPCPPRVSARSSPPTPSEGRASDRTVPTPHWLAALG